MHLNRKEITHSIFYLILLTLLIGCNGNGNKSTIKQKDIDKYDSFLVPSGTKSNNSNVIILKSKAYAVKIGKAILTEPSGERVQVQVHNKNLNILFIDVDKLTPISSSELKVGKEYALTFSSSEDLKTNKIKLHSRNNSTYIRKYKDYTSLTFTEEGSFNIEVSLKNKNYNLIAVVNEEPLDKEVKSISIHDGYNSLNSIVGVDFQPKITKINYDNSSNYMSNSELSYYINDKKYDYREYLEFVNNLDNKGQYELYVTYGDIKSNIVNISLISLEDYVKEKGMRVTGTKSLISGLKNRVIVKSGPYDITKYTSISNDGASYKDGIIELKGGTKPTITITFKLNNSNIPLTTTEEFKIYEKEDIDSLSLTINNQTINKDNERLPKYLIYSDVPSYNNYFTVKANILTKDENGVVQPIKKNINLADTECSIVISDPTKLTNMGATLIPLVDNDTETNTNIGVHCDEDDLGKFKLTDSISVYFSKYLNLSKNDTDNEAKLSKYNKNDNGIIDFEVIKFGNEFLSSINPVYNLYEYAGWSGEHWRTVSSTKATGSEDISINRLGDISFNSSFQGGIITLKNTSLNVENKFDVNILNIDDKKVSIFDELFKDFIVSNRYVFYKKTKEGLKLVNNYSLEDVNFTKHNKLKIYPYAKQIGNDRIADVSALVSLKTVKNRSFEIGDNEIEFKPPFINEDDVKIEVTNNVTKSRIGEFSISLFKNKDFVNLGGFGVDSSRGSVMPGETIALNFNLKDGSSHLMRLATTSQVTALFRFAPSFATEIFLKTGGRISINGDSRNPNLKTSPRSSGWNNSINIEKDFYEKLDPSKPIEIYLIDKDGKNNVIYNRQY
ncbi:hypothetical protein [Vibrio harveyi]